MVARNAGAVVMLRAALAIAIIFYNEQCLCATCALICSLKLHIQSDLPHQFTYFSSSNSNKLIHLTKFQQNAIQTENNDKISLIKQNICQKSLLFSIFLSRAVQKTYSNPKNQIF